MFKSICVTALMLSSFLAYSMEDIVLREPAHIRLPEPNVSLQANATHNVQEDILRNDRVHSLLVEQEAEDDFACFTRILTNYYGQSWREVVPFVEIDRSRALVRASEVNPYALTIEDFLAAGQPFFYSYDELGRPFIAFIHQAMAKNSTQRSVKPVITLIFLSIKTVHFWSLESMYIGEWSMQEGELYDSVQPRVDFTELGNLFVHRQGFLRDWFCQLLSLEEMKKYIAQMHNTLNGVEEEGSSSEEPEVSVDQSDTLSNQEESMPSGSESVDQSPEQHINNQEQEVAHTNHHSHEPVSIADSRKKGWSLDCSLF